VRIRIGVVDIATRLRSGRSGVLFPARDRLFSSPKRPDWLWGTPSLIFIGLQRSVFWGKATLDVCRWVVTQLQLVPSLWMNGAIILLPLYAFIPWTRTALPSTFYLHRALMIITPASSSRSCGFKYFSGSHNPWQFLSWFQDTSGTLDPLKRRLDLFHNLFIVHNNVVFLRPLTSAVKKASLNHASVHLRNGLSYADIVRSSFLYWKLFFPMLVAARSWFPGTLVAYN